MSRDICQDVPGRPIAVWVIILVATNYTNLVAIIIFWSPPIVRGFKKCFLFTDELP